MANILNWYRALHAFYKCAFIFLGTVLVTVFIFLINLWFIEKVAIKTMNPVEAADQQLEERIDHLTRPVYVPPVYLEVIKTQQSIMKKRKEHHWKLACLFFRNYYSVLFLKMILACVSALILFAVINKGWANAGLSLQALFLSLATVMIFAGFFPVVFKQQDNFTQNMTYYENYEKGELSIFKQLSSLQNRYTVVDSADFYRRLDSIVTVNNTTLNNLTNYVLSIDPEESQKITINEVLRQLQNFAKPVADSTKK